jgi:DNA modification methylase
MRPSIPTKAATAPARLKISYRPLSELKLDQRNPRQHSARQINQIAASIEAFGFNVPVLVDPDSKVIAGHGRVLACRKLAWTEVPTIALDGLTAEQSRAFMVADNRLSETSTWDDKLLAEALRDLAAVELDFSIEATGFSVTEIDLRIEGLEVELSAGARKTDRADAVQPVAGPPVSRVGDVWCLGEHRVLCGDALSAESYATLLQGQLADAVFTDPPYNVAINGHVSGLGGVQHREFVMASGEMSEGEFTQFLRTVCTNLAGSSREGSLHFICMDWRHMRELLIAAGSAYDEMKNLCIWSKDNAGMGSLYRSQHELVFVYKRGRAPHRNNVELGRHGRHRSNIWRYPGINSFSRHGEEGNLLALHPTVKPVALVADALLDCTARREIVLDPFLGSGTTLMAAERTGRRCLGLELDPLYVDTIVRRWQGLTGDTVRHAATGETFEARSSSLTGKAKAAGAINTLAVEDSNHGA